MATHADSRPPAEPDRVALLPTSIRPGMRVGGPSGRPFGSVASVETDPLTGRLQGVVVRYGLLRKRHARVPVTSITQVADGRVALEYRSSDLERLPTCHAPARSGR